MLKIPSENEKINEKYILDDLEEKSSMFSEDNMKINKN